MAEIFIEAESFKEKGGWVVDQQSMETLGSAYLMAHGMGVPVTDAKHTFDVKESGEYVIWARTRDWTAVWNVKDPAGKFRLALDGEELPETLGTNGKEWAWQKAGCMRLSAGAHEIALRDLTGFNGRVDAVYLTTERGEITEDIADMRKRLNWREIKETDEFYDLIVVGGGVAGICVALSAIRSGCKTLLLNDRGVLGGCNSSEIRVCMGGMINLPPYPNLGNVVKEIAPIMGTPETFKKEYYEDDRKLFAFEVSEAKRSVALNECVTDAETVDGKIYSVVSTNVITGKKTRFKGRLFADCSGDAVLSRLAGAETMYGREASNVFNETLAPETHEKLVMGHSIRWYSEDKGAPSAFPKLDWNLPFTDKNCLNVKNGDWEQETGFSRDMVAEIEYIRDFGLRAIYSNWSYQKNEYEKKDEYANYALEWVSPLGGKRESYRVVGGYILTQNDIEEHKIYDDATSCMTWSIDMHFPECDNAAEYEEPFRSYAYHRGIVEAYPIPYRCLYARDIENLFLSGRIVSCSHVAFSAIRVMRTLGQLGEVVGIAAGICRKKDCLPKDVYEKYLPELKSGMEKGVAIPAAFCCAVGSEESYHFKDIGWLNLQPYGCDERHIEKFKRGIKALKIKHKYPLPDKLK